MRPSSKRPQRGALRGMQRQVPHLAEVSTPRAAAWADLSTLQLRLVAERYFHADKRAKERDKGRRGGWKRDEALAIQFARACSTPPSLHGRTGRQDSSQPLGHQPRFPLLLDGKGLRGEEAHNADHGDFIILLLFGCGGGESLRARIPALVICRGATLGFLFLALTSLLVPDSSVSSICPPQHGLRSSMHLFWSHQVALPRIEKGCCRQGKVRRGRRDCRR